MKQSSITKGKLYPFQGGGVSFCLTSSSGGVVDHTTNTLYGVCSIKRACVCVMYWPSILPPPTLNFQVGLFHLNVHRGSESLELRMASAQSPSAHKGLFQTCCEGNFSHRRSQGLSSPWVVCTKTLILQRFWAAYWRSRAVWSKAHIDFVQRWRNELNSTSDEELTVIGAVGRANPPPPRLF